jgi:hypothetical protein
VGLDGAISGAFLPMGVKILAAQADKGSDFPQRAAINVCKTKMSTALMGTLSS